MKLFQPQAGYTIVEVMIFLVISVALFGTAVGNISMQNRRTQFTQSVNGLQEKIQDVLNDTSTGFYPSTNNFSCSALPTGPKPETLSPQEQGSNLECVFTGKVIKFESDADKTDYNIYTMIGNRLGTDVSNANKEVASLKEAKPKLLGVGANPGIVDNNTLLSGVIVQKIVSKDASGTATNVGSFAIISDFGKTTDINKSITGNASRVTLAGINNTSPTSGSPGDLENAVRLDTNILNSDNGIILCMQEAGNGRKASITIGGKNQQLSLENTIDKWPAECDTP